MTRSCLALSLFLLGCPAATENTKPDPGTGTGTGTGRGTPPSAGAALASIQGKAGLSGQATFAPKDGKLQVRVEVKSAPPGDHGVHIHEKGDCSDPEFKSAGGHYNPGGTLHGGPAGAAHHPGDFGNMTVGADGTGVLELTTDQLTVPDGPVSVVGKAIIIHENADDLTTQPTGNAGGRIGCGVINPPQ